LWRETISIKNLPLREVSIIDAILLIFLYFQMRFDHFLFFETIALLAIPKIINTNSFLILNILVGVILF
jgi:hypothetical protein